MWLSTRGQLGAPPPWWAWWQVARSQGVPVWRLFGHHDHDVPLVWRDRVLAAFAAEREAAAKAAEWARR